MDVTPRELRDIEISGEFRGYSKDEVNELLERAAATIEGLSERVRMLSDRLTAAQNDPARRDVVSVPEVATETPTRTLELAQRTLEMAQKTADEELTRARESSATMVRDAEIRANSMVSEAEAEARRRSDTERRRLHEEVGQLATRRDALRGDVESLDRFEADYRDRLVRAIEADLAVVRGRVLAAPGAVPELQAPIDAVPPLMADMQIAAPVGDAAVFAPSVPSTVSSTVASTVSSNRAPSDPITAEVMIPPSPEEIEARNGADKPHDVSTTGFGSPSTPEPVGASSDSPVDLFAAESAERQLPDDAFFTSLREAVRDDAPLEPDEERYFDEASRDPSLIRDVFRRRK